ASLVTATHSVHTSSVLIVWPQSCLRWQRSPWRLRDTPEESSMSSDPVIELAALLSLGVFHLLDVREPAPFAADHPPRAVRVPIEVWERAAKTSGTSLENVGFWERAIIDLAVTAHVPVVHYHDRR